VAYLGEEFDDEDRDAQVRGLETHTHRGADEEPLDALSLIYVRGDLLSDV
jgi:hypothetical protein